MKIEKDCVVMCSWCKSTGPHPTLISWVWERRRPDGTADLKTPTMCGECFTESRPHRQSGVGARLAAREWTNLERKFGAAVKIEPLSDDDQAHVF